MFTFMFVGSVAGSKQARNSICCATMAARSSSSCGLDGPPAKRLELLQSVQSVGKQTKASTMKMLSALQKRGALDSNVCERQLRSDIQAAVESVGKTMTPYGPIIQQVKLDAPRLQHWEICHPFAFLWYMTQHSAAFRKVMRHSTADGRKLRLVLYMDGLVPGNPFRQDKGRSIMCIYWCFVDWPAFMLNRTFAWPCLSILRESIMHSIPGGPPIWLDWRCAFSFRCLGIPLNLALCSRGLIRRTSSRPNSSASLRTSRSTRR